MRRQVGQQRRVAARVHEDGAGVVVDDGVGVARRTAGGVLVAPGRSLVVRRVREVSWHCVVGAACQRPASRRQFTCTLCFAPTICYAARQTGRSNLWAATLVASCPTQAS